MKDRTNEEGIDPVTDGPTDDARRRGESEGRHGGKHGAPQERTMIEEILEPENLAQAWKRVKANKGAPGIDGMTVADFPAFAREHWPRIAKAIREGNYRPAPVRRVFLPKSDGTQRPLGIPTVLDRMIQQAVAQVLSPLFEEDFSEHSYGYRPGRSALQAVVVMEEGWKEGRRHAVECDLKSFFDTVNHDRLIYIRGWLNYYKLSSTYKEVLALSGWVRRRVRLYYWKQWKQPSTRRRNLLALGADPATVHMATRSRKGYWRMSQNEIVRFALNNRWLEEQGVPDMNAPAALAALDKPRSHFAWTQRSGVKAVWIVLHYGSKARV